MLPKVDGKGMDGLKEQSLDTGEDGAAINSSTRVLLILEPLGARGLLSSVLPGGWGWVNRHGDNVEVT